MSNQHPTTEDIRAFCAVAAPRNFWAFCCYWDWDFFYRRRPVLREFAELLQRVYDTWMNGQTYNIGASMPPRTGKSYVLSLFSGWWIGNANTSSVMRCSCTAELYQSLSKSTRYIVSDERYRAVFPDAVLARDARGVRAWRLTTSIQDAYFGAGVGGTIIGKGADVGITDDLYRGHADALSEARNAMVWEWKQSTFDSRLEACAPQIHVGTRWTEDDVLGRMYESGMFAEYLRIPALTPEGRSFCEDVKTTEDYRRIRDGLRDGNRDGFIWLSEYMQNPVDPKGYLFPLSSLSFGAVRRRGAGVVERVCFVDPADTGEDGYCAVFCDVYDAGDRVRAALRRVILVSGAGVDAGTGLVVEAARAEKTERIFIETNGVGVAALSACRKAFEDGDEVDVVGYKESQNKITKIIINHEDVKRLIVFDKDYHEDGDYVQFMGNLTKTPAKGLSAYAHRKDPADALSNVARYLKGKYSELLNIDGHEDRAA